MTNPFSALGSVPIMEVIQGTMQRAANIRNAQILGDERQQLIQLRQQEMQERQATLKALQQDLQGGIETQIDKGTLPSENDSPIAAAQKNVRQLQTEFQRANATAANIAAAGGSVEAARFYQTQALNTQRQLTSAMRELRLEQSNQTKMMGEAAGSLAPDGANFGQVMNDLRAQDPSVDKKYPWDRDVDGNPVFGETSKRTLNTIRDHSMTAKEQLDVKLKADKMEEDAKDKELKRKEEELRIKDLNAKVAIDQVNADRAKKGMPLLGREGVSERKDEGGSKSADRLQSIADREPTKAAVDSARAAVKNKFKDQEFDESLDTLARSVAAKTNEIRAQAAKRGEEMDLDEARSQAIDTLRPFVKESTRGGIDIPIVGHVGGNKTLSFRRAGTETKPASGDEEALAKKLSNTGLEFAINQGKVTGLGGKALKVSNKTQYDALPSGTEFIGPDGKPWIKP